jgi:hypothetical protein
MAYVFHRWLWQQRKSTVTAITAITVTITPVVYHGRAYGLHGDNRHGYHAGGYNYGYGTRTHDGYITITPPNSN